VVGKVHGRTKGTLVAQQVNLTPAAVSSDGWRSWVKFTLVSLIFFQITAATFTSLGVALPFMIEELTWSWSSAGLGFSVLSFMVGIASRIPSWTLRKFGTRATFGVGGALMAAGFVLLATTNGLYQYFIGAGLAGLGYTLCSVVPGVDVINQWLPHRRSFAIGLYMTIGGLGGVAGPLIVTSVVATTGSWRMHWWLMAISIAALAAVAIFALRSPEKRADDDPDSGLTAEKHSDSVFKTRFEWHFDDVLRTPQYYIIVAATTLTFLSGVTTNTWAVTHMGNLGIAISVAAGALSAHALINSLSRAFGGALATWVDPKWLLVTALLAETIGMLALAAADNMTMIVLFALGEGYGFGMCIFSTTMLLVNYYGPKEAPKTMGTMYLITTIAMIGPVTGGLVADKYGGFENVFRFYAIILAICLVAVALMKPPKMTAREISPDDKATV
jgi:OFA family oxalate/formate antiporter-like MFS transporter